MKGKRKLRSWTSDRSSLGDMDSGDTAAPLVATSASLQRPPREARIHFVGFGWRRGAYGLATPNETAPARYYAMSTER